METDDPMEIKVWCARFVQSKQNADTRSTSNEKVISAMKKVVNAIALQLK
jgi:hypothetical protein